MASLLVLCGETNIKISEFKEIAVLNIFRLNALTSQGISCFNLFDIPLDNRFNRKLCSSIDHSLHLEHEYNADLKWAPLAFLNVHYRFVRYFQFKKKLEIWAKKNHASKLVLSSCEDKDLLLAAEAVCNINIIKLEKHDGAIDEYSYSGVANFLNANDFPDQRRTDPMWMIYCNAFLQRLFNKKILVQPYWNFEIKKQTGIFSWGRSISLTGSIASRIRNKWFKKDTDSLINLLEYPSYDHSFLLKKEFWQEFDEYDMVIINSSLNYFYEYYPKNDIDILAKKLDCFLKYSRVKRIVAIHDCIPSVRICSCVAKRHGIQVDCLPHGIIWEDFFPATGTLFSPDRILAWNESSRDAFIRNGLSSAAVFHPRNNKEIVDTQPVPKNLSKCKVLILLSVRIIASMEQRIDCFENDFFEIYAALTKLKILDIAIKFHHSSPLICRIMRNTIYKFEDNCKHNFTVIESHSDTESLINKYDLLIIGACTTGIIEAIRSSTPFIVFRGYLSGAGILDGFDFPQANSSEELIEKIKCYDVKYYNKQFKCCAESLRKGRNPLD